MISITNQQHSLFLFWGSAEWRTPLESAAPCLQGCQACSGFYRSFFWSILTLTRAKTCRRPTLGNQLPLTKSTPKPFQSPLLLPTLLLWPLLGSFFCLFAFSLASSASFGPLGSIFLTKYAQMSRSRLPRSAPELRISKEFFGFP